MGSFVPSIESPLACQLRSRVDCVDHTKANEVNDRERDKKEVSGVGD